MAARVLRGLCRARPALLPARTPPGIVHRAAAGAAPSSEFRSEYALDRLYLEQARSDPAEGTQTVCPYPIAGAVDPEARMLIKHKNKINKSGELIINSEVSRYQMKNLADCLQKIRNMIKEATQKSSVVSKENSQLLIARVQKMNRERLRQKKIHSTIKQSRRVDFD
ncbi:large ribosomal subunit protein mL62 isoform X2 [Eretmochelys imbricata]